VGPRRGLPSDIIKSDGGDGERKEIASILQPLKTFQGTGIGRSCKQTVNYLNAPVRNVSVSKVSFL